MIIKKDKSTTQNYFQDNSGVLGAHADSVAIAENEDDICKFLAEMSKNNVPVTVVGALTGNTAAGLAFGGRVLSLEKLNSIGAIRQIDKDTAFIRVGAGASLSNIKLKIYNSGWMYPPDPTEQSASIGGSISTNASGARSFKFGSTRRYVQALSVIFSDGSKSFIERGKFFADESGSIAFNTDKGVKRIKLPQYKLPYIKNAAGYYNYPNCDLIDIFIGHEGTICVIVDAVLRLIPHFREVFGGIVFLNNYNDMYRFISEIKEKLNAMSLEYFDNNALNLIRDKYPAIPLKTMFAIMFEQDVYDANVDLLMDKWYNIMRECNVDLDSVWFASNLNELERLKIFRHAIPERVNEIIRKSKIPKVGTDFAVPESRLHDMINFCQERFKELGVLNLTFGHIGQSHLHANVLASNKEEYEKCRKLYIDIACKVVEFNGTVSAEHGIGKIRHVFLKKMLGEEGFKEMAVFKKNLDNNCILGQDNIFPKKYLF